MDRVPGCHVCAHLRPWLDHGWGGGAPDADGAIAGALLGLNLGEAIGEASLLSVADADPGRRIRPGPVTRRAFFGLEGAIRMARSTQVYGGRASLGIVRRAIERWEFAESGVLPAGAGRDGVAWPDGWLVTRHALHGPSAAEGAVEGFCPVPSTERL